MAEAIVVSDQRAQSLVVLYTNVGRMLAVHRQAAQTFAAICDTAVQIVPGAQHASISRGRSGRFETVGATGDLPQRVDLIQYELGSGPCVDAILEDTVFRTGDLPGDARWPEFGRRAFAEAGVMSMLAFRLYLEDDDLIAALNLFSTEPHAFDESAVTIGTLLATHGALAVSGSIARERIANLERALMTNREIGIAVGVLMTQHKITREHAFDLLRIASQHGHRKLADIAAGVANTGSLTLPAEGKSP